MYPLPFSCLNVVGDTLATGPDMCQVSWYGGNDLRGRPVVLLLGDEHEVAGGAPDHGVRHRRRPCGTGKKGSRAGLLDCGCLGVYGCVAVACLLGCFWLLSRVRACLFLRLFSSCDVSAH